jgi:hypothetical protein
MITVIRISAEGDVETREVTPGDLDAYRAMIDGGWLEVIQGQGWIAFMDEEGKLKELPVNTVATMSAKYLGWSIPDSLCGPVVFGGTPDANGMDTEVEEHVVTVISGVHAAFTRHQEEADRG